MSLRALRLAAVMWFALLECCANAMVLSQEQYLYRVWSVEAGLPQISVTAIVQDGDGFLWLGTQNGLARFDGLQFEVFNTSNTAQFSSNVVTRLFIDSRNQLWIGTANGLMRYHNGQFERVDNDAPLKGSVTGFAEMPDGTVYIGANQLYYWQNQKLSPSTMHSQPVFQLFQHSDTLYIGGQAGFATLSPTGYLWHSVNAGAESLQVTEFAIQRGKLYLGSSLGLFYWHAGLWQPISLTDQAEEPRTELLYLDAQQRLWVSTYSQMYVLEDGVVKKANMVKGKHGEFDWVESMLQDKHQNLWFGSRTHGLKRLRKPPTQRFSTSQGIPDPYTWAVLPWQQHLLVGTNRGLSILQYGAFQPLMANQYLPNSFVYSLAVDGNNLWVGTRAGLSLLDNQTLAWRRNYDDLSHLLVTTLACEKDTLWIGTNGGLFYIENDTVLQTDIPENLTKVRVRMVLPDRQGRLWIATENGLYVRDANGFAEVEDLPISRSFVSNVTQFEDGNLLIGSIDKGFVFGQPGAWHWFSQQNGLPSDGVVHVEKIENILVISNLQGFYRLNYTALLEGKVKQLYMLVDDRRPEAETDSHRCCNGAGSSKGALHQGQLWYPTLDGVIALPLQQLVQYQQIPQPVIKTLQSADKRYEGADIKLPPEHRDWQIGFTAPYYVQASSLQLRYQLVGYDNDWVEAGGRREAFYTNLPAGTYQFIVQAKVAGDYRWSESALINIKLAAYWHETWWARLLFVVILLAALWGVYYWRLKALARSQQQLTALVAAKTQELHQANERLQRMSMQDALTGLYNRHYLDLNIQQILSRANRHAAPLIWAILDLDHFKRINDNFGHHTGDNILMVVADILRQNSRGSDHIIRWGGEEFLLVLEHNVEASMTLQRIYDAIASYPWQRDMGLTQPLTCSIGAVSQMTEWNWQHSLRLADQALYMVKDHGRQGYLLLRAPEPVPAAVLAEDANVVNLLAEGKLHAISNKDFTVIPS